jgi:thioredoxin 1
MHTAMLIQLGLGLLVGASLGAAMGYVGKCSRGTFALTANPLRGAVVGAVLGGAFAFITGPSAAVAGDGKGLVQIETLGEFERYMAEADKPVMVDFYADWCGPCRRLAPTIEKLAKEYDGRAVIAKINVDKLGGLAREFGIRGIPAVLFFQDGREVHRLIGGQPKRAYEQVLDDLINQL